MQPFKGLQARPLSCRRPLPLQKLPLQILPLHQFSGGFWTQQLRRQLQNRLRRPTLQ
jgi:hypothetical protein